MSAASLLRRSRGAIRGCYHGFRRSFAAQTLEIGNQRRRQQKQQLPWLLLSSPDNPESRYLYELTGDDRKPIAFNREIHLPEIAGHNLLGSSQGYLFSVDETAEIHVTDPLTGARLPIPSMVALPNFVGVIRDPAGNITDYVTHEHDPPLGNFRPQTVVFERSRRGGGGGGGEISLFAFLDPKQVRFIDVHSMKGYHIRGILSPSLDTAVLIHEAYSQEPCRPAFARIGSSSAASSWNALYSPSYYFQDVIFHQGRLHAIDNCGTLVVFDLDDPLGQPFVSPEDPRRDEWYLVESPDREDLFSVARRNEFKRTFNFMVFKLDKTTYKWNQVDGIGDVAMFLGPNHSIAFSATHFSGIIKPNSIYFTDFYMVGALFNYGGKPEDVGDTGVYNLGDDSFEYYELSDGLHKLNWPPPIWYAQLQSGVLVLELPVQLAKSEGSYVHLWQFGEGLPSD